MRENSFFLALELIEGPTLKQFYSLYSPHQSILRGLFFQLITAIRVCHDACVAHGDIKPQNTMISTRNGSPLLKLIDFGSAIRLPSRNTPTSDWAGTPINMSPEKYRIGYKRLSETYDPFKADIWAYGMTVFEVCLRQHPFENLRTEPELMAALESFELQSTAEPTQLETLLQFCFNKSPNGRPPATYLAQYAWLVPTQKPTTGRRVETDKPYQIAGNM